MTDPTLRDELLRLELAIARRDPAAIPGGYEAVLDEGFYETGGARRTRRSSVWVRDPDGGRWRLRFNQGTPVPPDVP